MKILIASDHGGFLMKESLCSYLKSKCSVYDRGCYSEDSVDYPQIAFDVAKELLDEGYDYAILICGTGSGMSIAANKVLGIRAVMCCSERQAFLARSHNDANVLCLGERLIGMELAKSITETFLDAKFEGLRHKTRVEQIISYENNIL